MFTCSSLDSFVHSNESSTAAATVSAIADAVFGVVSCPTSDEDGGGSKSCDERDAAIVDVLVAETEHESNEAGVVQESEEPGSGTAVIGDTS